MFLQVTKENGPYYVHLGHHKTQEGLQKKFEERLGVSQEELRMVSVCFTGKEGKTSEDCPIAKWILQRAGLHEDSVKETKRKVVHVKVMQEQVTPLDVVGQDLGMSANLQINTQKC